LSVICYQTKTEWWQQNRNHEDLGDQSINVKATLSIVSLWAGCSSSQNYHRGALQYVRFSSNVQLAVKKNCARNTKGPSFIKCTNLCWHCVVQCR